MIWKLVFIAILAVGAWGRSINDREGMVMDQMANIYCQAAHAEDKTQQVKESMVAFSECVKGIFDVNALKKDFDVAKQTNVFDQLFKKHCTKVPQLKSCFNAVVTGMGPCLPSTVRSNAGKDMDTILDFACENDGARLSSFFESNGPQCLMQQEKALTACKVAMDANITRVMGETGPGVSFKMTEEEGCNLAEPAADCVLAALKQCSNPIPGNLAEELHKKTSCHKETQTTEGKPAAADGSSPPTASKD